MIAAKTTLILILLLTLCVAILGACSPPMSDTGGPAYSPSSPWPHPEPTTTLAPGGDAGGQVSPTPYASSGIPAVGDPAPDFSHPTVSGDMITLSDYRGDKSIVLLFYRTGG